MSWRNAGGMPDCLDGSVERSQQASSSAVKRKGTARSAMYRFMVSKLPVFRPGLVENK